MTISSARRQTFFVRCFIRCLRFLAVSQLVQRTGTHGLPDTYGWESASICKSLAISSGELSRQGTYGQLPQVNDHSLFTLGDKIIAPSLWTIGHKIPKNANLLGRRNDTSHFDKSEVKYISYVHLALRAIFVWSGQFTLWAERSNFVRHVLSYNTHNHNKLPCYERCTLYTAAVHTCL